MNSPRHRLPCWTGQSSGDGGKSTVNSPSGRSSRSSSWRVLTVFCDSSPTVPQLREDLEALHKLGILVRDVHVGNFLHGKLVDFSLAWTMYHPCLDRISDSDLRTLRRAEVLELERLIYDWWDQQSDSVDVKVPEGLSRCTHGDEYGVDPREYDWHKWEDSSEATETDQGIFEVWDSDESTGSNPD
ncbi:unnamed protein product [Discula destructiva]